MPVSPLKPRRLVVERLETRDQMTAIIPVGNTRSYPASATVSIEQTYDTNNNGFKDNSDPTYICSGGMIGKHYVLTAAHCLYDSQEGGFADFITVRPGRTPSGAPFGSASATYITVPTAWTTGNYLSDIGVIKLDRDIGVQTGWYGMLVASDSQLVNKQLNLRHYPGSPKSDGRQQFYSSGFASNVTSNVISYRHSVISTFGGSSGAPLYFSDTRQIVGVHVRGSLGQAGPNSSTRLTTPFFRFVQNFRSAHQNEPLSQAGNSRAIGEVYDLETGRVSGIQSTPASLQRASLIAGIVDTAVPDADAPQQKASSAAKDKTVVPSAGSTVSNEGSELNSVNETNCVAKSTVEAGPAIKKNAADALFATVEELLGEHLPATF